MEEVTREPKVKHHLSPKAISTGSNRTDSNGSERGSRSGFLCKRTAKKTVRLELRTLKTEIRSFFMRVRKIRFLLIVTT